MLSEFGRLLIILGLVLALAGVVLLFIDRIPLVGRLPGDIIIRRKNFTFYFPLVTCLLLSILLTILLLIFRKR